MNKYIFITAPPGVGLSQAVVRLKSELDAETADVEEEIKKDPDTDKALQRIGAVYTAPINMGTITFHLPRKEISTLWKAAVARALKKLEDSDKTTKILCGHLIYYSGKRNEFYSVVDRENLILRKGRDISFEPGIILSLADDIYDMYIRLPELYSSDQVESLLRKLQRDAKTIIKNLRKDRLSSLTSGWRIRNLLHLLVWRSIEPIMAGNLALQFQLEDRFLVWPVKQLIKAITVWLKNSQPIAIYISHPITDPRNERNESGRWPEFTNEVNQLQKIFAEHEVTIVAPTGIDELRFQVENQQYTGRLQARWPLISGKLLYDEAGKATENDLLLPRYWNFQKGELSLLKEREYTKVLRSEVNAFLQILVREIEAQISSRDFLFIHYSEGLVVYRPYYARDPRPSFSGGVDAEVRLWEDIVQLKGQKRIVFIHFKTDIEKMLGTRLQESRKQFSEDFLDSIFEAYTQGWPTITRDIVRNIIKNEGKVIEHLDILNAANIAPRDQQKLERAFSENWEKGKIDLLKKYLTNGVKEQGLIGVWVLEDFKKFRAHVPNIVKFFRDGKPIGNDWEAQIKSLFPDKLLQEASELEIENNK
jgi:hypothetical protein